MMAFPPFPLKKGQKHYPKFDTTKLFSTIFRVIHGANLLFFNNSVL